MQKYLVTATLHVCACSSVCCPCQRRSAGLQRGLCPLFWLGNVFEGLHNTLFFNWLHKPEHKWAFWTTTWFMSPPRPWNCLNVKYSKQIFLPCHLSLQDVPSLNVATRLLVARSGWTSDMLVPICVTSCTLTMTTLISWSSAGTLLLIRTQHTLGHAVYVQSSFCYHIEEIWWS